MGQAPSHRAVCGTNPTLRLLSPETSFYLFLFLQGHLISSQLFVLKSFCFCLSKTMRISEVMCKRFKKSLNNLLSHLVLEVERLMCEVEFWEVFFMECTKVFNVVTLNPHVGCRLANLEAWYQDTPSGFLGRAGNEINSFIRLLFPMHRYIRKNSLVF